MPGTAKCLVNGNCHFINAIHVLFKRIFKCPWYNSEDVRRGLIHGVQSLSRQGKMGSKAQTEELTIEKRVDWWVSR